MNRKASAWDLVGGMFWKLGRASARPSAREIALFLAGTEGGRVCVVGASTKELIEAALTRENEVTVIDFSPVMCENMEKEVRSPRLSCRTADILAPLSPDLSGRFDLVAADRLLNRFVRADCPAFFANVGDLLAEGGRARISVKLGFYEMDLRLMDEGRRRGTLERFYDPSDQTIDYARARDELSAVPVEHGSIPRDVLLQWYVARGRESRFERGDLIAQVAAARERSPSLVLEAIEDFPDAGTTVLMHLRRAGREEG
jgi:hypothetical protein